jgi:hypothetical protein
MNKWAELVSKTFQENKHKVGYKLKNAMKDAKKVWKTLKKRILFKGGKKELIEEVPAVGGKSRRKTAKNSRSRKSRK